jgi:hypothetical protein
MVEGEIEACQCRMRFVYRGYPHAGAKALKCSVDLRGPRRAALPRLCRHSIPLSSAWPCFWRLLRSPRMRQGRGTRSSSFFLCLFLLLVVRVAATEVVDEHLLDRFVVGDEDVADGVSADEVANFFGKILSVIARALEGLRHEDDLQARLAGNVLGILDVAKEDEIAQAIHLCVCTEDIDGFADFAGRKRAAAIGQHFFEDGRHLCKVASVLGVNASADGLSAVGEAKQEIADALEANHEFHAGEQLAGFGGTNLGDGGSHATVDFHVEGVELAFALAEGIKKSGRSGGDAFGRRARGFFGHVTGFDGAAHDVMVGRFGSRALGRGAHECVRRAGTRATRYSSWTVAGRLPFMRSDGQRLSIEFSAEAAVNKL